MAAVGGVGGAVGLALGGLLLALLGCLACRRSGGKGKLLSAAAAGPAVVEANAAAAVLQQQQAARAQPAGSLPPGWEEHTDGVEVWYVNGQGESVWERPSSV